MHINILLHKIELREAFTLIFEMLRVVFTFFDMTRNVYSRASSGKFLREKSSGKILGLCMAVHSHGKQPATPVDAITISKI